MCNCGCCCGEVKTFGEDVEFLSSHKDTVVLSDQAGTGKIAVVPGWQGRVLTSTAGGDAGQSFGWINYELVESGELQEHINVYGGEDRFWMGPEGGQYAIFFTGGTPYDLENWYTPAIIDTDAYDVVEKSESKIKLTKTGQVKNRSGASFDLKIDRAVKILDKSEVEDVCGVSIDSNVSMVAYESENTLTNIGNEAWSKDKGLLSIWILGMFKPSPDTTIAIPFKSGSEDELGPLVNDAYFGKIPNDRLVVKDDILYYKGDGEMRGKIGISPQRAKSFLGSYSPSLKTLTLVHFTLPEGETDYVNSMWEDQKEPFAGDVVNSYNDGPPAPGEKPLGPFYELETSSPALPLAAGDSATHVNRTFHFQGSEAELDAIAKATLGVGLDEIVGAL